MTQNNYSLITLLPYKQKDKDRFFDFRIEDIREFYSFYVAFCFCFWILILIVYIAEDYKRVNKIQLIL